MTQATTPTPRCDAAHALCADGRVPYTFAQELERELEIAMELTLEAVRLARMLASGAQPKPEPTGTGWKPLALWWEAGATDWDSLKQVVKGMLDGAKPEPTDAQLDALLADWCDAETSFRGSDGSPYRTLKVPEERARHMLRRALSEFSAPNLEPEAPNRFEVPAWNAYLALDSLVGPKPSTNFNRHEDTDIFGRVKGTWAASAEARCRDAYAELGRLFYEARQSSVGSSEIDSRS